MTTISAVFPTGSASRYLHQLLKHFAHKVPAEWTDTDGTAALPPGNLRLRADGKALHLTGEARSDEDVQKLIFVVEVHLVRFAWRDSVDLVWTDETGTAIVKSERLAAALAEERAKFAAKRTH